MDKVELNALSSLSDKETILRGYSQRKIKVLHQSDGRGLLDRNFPSSQLLYHKKPKLSVDLPDKD
jgi:hypothetical protein